ARRFTGEHQAAALMLQHVLEPGLEPAAEHQISADRFVPSYQRRESATVAKADDENLAGIHALHRRQSIEGILIGSEFSLEIGVGAGRALAIANARLINSHGD